MDGTEVLKRVKAAYPATGIIVLTGNASLDSAIDATNWGAFSYILKPYDIVLLLLNIRRAIEKQRTEEALRVSDERLKLALATSHMGVWEWDPVTDNVYRSAETIAILGDSAVDWTLASFKKILHRDDAGSVIGAFDRAVADKTVYRVEYRIVRPDGELRWISDIGRAEYDYATDDEALNAFHLLSKTEGIIPAPESSHAIKAAIDEAKKADAEGKSRVILFNLSGHGHVDMAAYDAYFAGQLEDFEYPAAKVKDSLAHLPEVKL